MSRPIKAGEVQPGDTVQYECTQMGIAAIYTIPISKVVIRDSDHWVLVETAKLGRRGFPANTELTLLDRPAPQLPTEPGSVITAYEVRGERNENGWRLMYIACDDFAAGPDNWISETDIAGAIWHYPENITSWLPATVTTNKEPSDEVHNHGPAEGLGLDCPEEVIDGRLVGACLTNNKETGQ